MRRPRARRSRTTALSAEQALVYADSSALVKLVIEEPESAVLEAYLGARDHVLVTSRLALVEVARATRIANPSDEVADETRRLLESCLLVDVTEGILRAAAGVASGDVRTLDAIHLASAQHVDPDELLAYDRRLAAAARRIGLCVAHPGAAPPGDE